MTSVLIISTLIFLPIAAIIVIVAFVTRKKEEEHADELKRVYTEIVANDHLEITDEEVAYDKIFAVDAKRKVFVFVHTKNDPAYSIIRLNGLSVCLIDKIEPEVIATGNGTSTVTALQHREVRLSFLSGGSILADLPIYSEAFDGAHSYAPLTKIAMAWQQKLNRIIRS